MRGKEAACRAFFWFELVRAEGGKHCKRFRTKDRKKTSFL